MAISPVQTITTSERSFDFAGLAQRGPSEFDDVVWRKASASGLVLQKSGGSVTRALLGTAFHMSNDKAIHTSTRVPDALLAGWHTQPPKVDLAGTAKLFAYLSTVPGGLAIASVFLGRSTGDGALNAGVYLWGSLVVILWLGFFAAAIKAKTSQPKS